MAQIGNKKNAQLNGDWGKHTQEKRHTSKRRRSNQKEVIKEELDGKGRKEIHDNQRHS